MKSRGVSLKVRNVFPHGIIVNDSIYDTIKEILITPISNQEIRQSLKYKLRNRDNYDIAKELLSRVKVLWDKECWIINDDWSHYATFHKKIAHRLSYELFVGDIITGNFICHHCDRKGCISFNHLFQGTASDNHRDWEQKNEDQTSRSMGNFYGGEFWNKIKSDNPELNISREAAIRVMKSLNLSVPLAARFRKLVGNSDDTI